VRRQIVIEAYVESLRMVWIVTTALAGAMMVASFVWTKEISLERELKTEQGFIYEKRKIGVDEEQR
jgi:hypothetical protein